jgi:hypothetical protein
LATGRHHQGCLLGDIHVQNVTEVKAFAKEYTLGFPSKILGMGCGHMHLQIWILQSTMFYSIHPDVSPKIHSDRGIYYLLEYRKIQLILPKRKKTR